MKTRNLLVATIGLFLLATAALVSAQQSDSAAPAATPASTASADANNMDELAKKLSNPVAALISVPFQYNFARAYGDDGYQNLLNIQPVI
ncbi:MAG TPA: hypothetical protein VIS57_08015, partial [Xanthomonadales bacterium]